MSFSAVLFDLDGTILDSSPIICAAMSVASAEFGHHRPPEVFAPYVGPPPWHTFGEVTGEPPAVVDRIVRRYRAIYASMMSTTPVFPGVGEVIDALSERGVPLAVATSKLRSAAIELLEGVGLAGRFVTIQGAGADAASADKAGVIGRAIDDLVAAGIDVSTLVMVGDREHDVEGARLHGVPVILVRWGYAGPGEAAGTLAVADDPAELLDLLVGDAG